MGILIVGALLPPYVPSAAVAEGDPDVPVQNSQFLLVEDGFLMKSSSLTKQGARRAFAQGIIIKVQSGDSLESLAAHYKISADTIRWANKLDEDATLKPDQELVILPVDGVVHTVSRGQTLSRIAELYGIGTETISTQNRIEGNFIIAGQELIIPGGKPILTKPADIALGDLPFTSPRTNNNPVTQPKNPQRTSGGFIEKATTFTDNPTTGTFQWPCGKCGITQYFHEGHYALDIQTKGGGPIYAAEAGTIIRAETGWNGGYGNVLEVDHGNGMVSLYGHNKELYVKVGDTVERGQEIAWMGNTGLVYGKTGIHVHFEVRVKGIKRNPLLYLQ